MSVITLHLTEQKNNAQVLPIRHSMSLTLWVRNICEKNKIGYFDNNFFKSKLVEITRLMGGECQAPERLGLNFLNIHFTDDSGSTHVIILQYSPQYLEVNTESNAGKEITFLVFKKATE